MTSLSLPTLAHTWKTTTAVHSRIFYGMQGFRVLLPAWKNLLETNVSNHFHHQPEWFAAILPTIPHEDFFFYVEEINGHTSAIVPMHRSQCEVARIPLHSIEFLSNDHIPFCDYIVREKHDALGLATRMLGTLKRERINGDVLALNNLAPDAHALQDLELTSLGIHLAQEKRICNSLKVRGMEEMLESFSENFQGNLRKARNKVTQAGNVRFEWVQEPAALESAFEQFLQVEASGWKGEAGTAIAQDSVLRNFYHNLIREFAPRGQCALHLMFVGDTPIGGQFCLLNHESCYLLKIGYDQAFKHFAPGNMLMEQLVRHFENSHVVSKINLITGMEWHNNWRPVPATIMNYLLFNLTSRGLLAYTLHQGNSLRKHWSHLEDNPV